MSDLEKQLSQALSHAAADAPQSDQTAIGARRRLRRRRARLAAAVGVVAVLAIVVPTAVFAGGRGESVPPVVEQPSDTAAPAPADGWQIITEGGVEVEIPAAWRRCEVGILIYAPGGPGGDPCRSVSMPLRFLNDTFLPARDLAEGEIRAIDERGGRTWGGYVWVDDGAVFVQTPERATTRRVLDSVREVDGGSWQTVELEGVLVEIPGDWAPLDCTSDWPVYGPADSCDAGGLAVYGAATFDPKHGPGVRSRDRGATWDGYEYVGEQVVNVEAVSASTAARILGSARER